MNSPGSRVFYPEPGPQHHENARGRDVTTSSPTRPRGLSSCRVTQLIADLLGRCFYGKLTLHFEAGHIVCAKLEQTIKE